MANADTSNIEDAVIRATHEILTKPDWSANIGICDWLKRRPNHIPLALRVIKQRLRHKELSVQNMAIELIATLVKNCSEVRAHIAHPTFLSSLLDKLPKKIKEPNARFFLKNTWKMDEQRQYDRILVLLKTWARQLGSQHQGRTFRQTYDKLKASGCKFPNITEKGMVPSRQPKPQPRSDRKKAVPSNTRSVAAGGPGEVDTASFTDRECRSAMETYVVLEQMLTASESGRQIQKDELIQSLLTQIVAAHKSVSKRIPTTSTPSVLDELLRANDKLIWVCDYYKGLVNGTRQRIQNKPKKPEAEAKSAASDKKSNKKANKKKKDVPTEEEVAALKKKYLAKRKIFRQDKSDKSARREMRAAKRDWEEAKERLEDEDEDEDEEEEEPEEKKSKAKPAQPARASKTVPTLAAGANLFNLAPPPGESVAMNAVPAQVSSAPVNVFSIDDPQSPVESAAPVIAPTPAPAPAPAYNGDDLSDPFAALAMRHGPSSTANSSAPANANAAVAPVTAQSGGVDLMDLFGSPAPQSQPAVQPVQPQQHQQSQQQPSGGEIDLMGLFG
eukprot:CAMPEP_0114505852 /NCGR_PEP_ID=MMETSP0109-20121206/11083_1 /TAXON_ID=29199 /ORGANISM="Chlorarachnion reptans, Strain CCCM449" /LENGTH=557 /DNA_ID=CAMNT_0001684337 /DNA_START=98 /DNA_END=1771 /DNA_ORIENTATION=+